LHSYVSRMPAATHNQCSIFQALRCATAQAHPRRTALPNLPS
jgi:hypothetical protein